MAVTALNGCKDGLVEIRGSRSEDAISDAEKAGCSKEVSYVAGEADTPGLRRALNGRHAYMISLASGVGTGLFMGSGVAIYMAGPLGVLLGYSLFGLAVSEVAFISAETIGFLPVSGGFIRFVTRFGDRALGITVALTFWYLLSITIAADVVAASSLVAYWRPDLNLAIFITVFLVLILFSNLMPVRFYGETEFFFGMLKTLLIVGLIIACFLVDWGVNPAHEYIGGKFWAVSSPIKEYLVPGSTGRFLAIWGTFINASFAMGNIQIACIGAGEVANPRVNVPRAMRRIFIRIFLFYILSLLSVGLILDSNDSRVASKAGTSSSPFVLAFTNVGIKVVPSIINAVVITSAFSAGNGMVFLASRVLVGLAQDGNAPKFLTTANKWGVPWPAVLCSFPLGLLAYLTLGGSGATTVFSWFINLIGTAGLFIWCIICFTYLRFYYGLKSRGISRDELPYKSWGQPYAAYAAGIFCFLVLITSGFGLFFPGNFTAAGFLSNYIACFLVPALYIVLKIFIRSPWIRIEDMDFSPMDDIRTERALKEASPPKKFGFWRKLREKLFDQ
ncbi:hypothetical protein QQS21_001452 [Conoideocrella luteorostrata]|uniref:Amino acid permease/ SLC12A domain-containing protein n=1 Tax=Conoideocrella luteorostrata TaxID=1105319 RepID=A0AAJ0CZL2_9HYPO|nr:hypothetical protein QQS21_001452 [Conoideocrella luteorostrata]